MIPERTTSLAAYVEELASSGRISFTREDAMEALGVSHGAFLDAAASPCVPKDILRGLRRRWPMAVETAA